MHRSTSEYELRKMEKAKIPLIVVNAFVFITAFAAFCICIWIRFDLDFSRWVVELDWYTYWYCMYVVIIAMSLILFTTILQTYGAAKESRGMLLASMVLFAFAWVLDFVGATVMLVYGVEESRTLTEELKEVFFRMIYAMDYDPVANAVLKQVQEYVECCGANGAEDYIYAMKPVPVECRDMVTGGEFWYGCSQQLAWWLEPWSATLGAICVAFLILHIVQIVLAHKLRKRIAVYERTADYEYD